MLTRTEIRIKVHFYGIGEADIVKFLRKKISISSPKLKLKLHEKSFSAASDLIIVFSFRM